MLLHPHSCMNFGYWKSLNDLYQSISDDCSIASISASEKRSPLKTRSATPPSVQCWQNISFSHLSVITYANLIKYWIITSNPYQSLLWHSSELTSGSQHLPCSCSYVMVDYPSCFTQISNMWRDNIKGQPEAGGGVEAGLAWLLLQTEFGWDDVSFILLFLCGVIL